MITFLFYLNILGVALLASRVFDYRVGFLAALIFATSPWNETLVASEQIRIFLMTIVLIYGLWLILKIKPKLGLPFLVFISLLIFLVLNSDFNFWLKHGFSADPTFVPIIHEYIDSCRPVFSIPVCRLVYNKPAFFIRQYTLNFLSHFSTDTLFITPKKGTLFLAPFFYLGLFSILFSWQKNLLLILWLSLFPLMASFTTGFDYFHSALGLALLPIISAWGIFQAIEFIVKKQK